MAKTENPFVVEMKTLGRRASSTVCKMCIIFDELTDEEREAITLAFEDSNVQSTMIGRWLRGRGYQVTDLSIRRHRRGDCKQS